MSDNLITEFSRNANEALSLETDTIESGSLEQNLSPAMEEAVGANDHLREPSSQWAQAFGATPAPHSASQADGIKQSFQDVKPAHGLFQPLSPEMQAHMETRLTEVELVKNIPVEVTVELGRTTLPIRNILQLSQGSVVELDGLAGEPMSVLVNGYLIAHGEVVVVNDKFGIRLTDIVTPQDRFKRVR